MITYLLSILLECHLCILHWHLNIFWKANLSIAEKCQCQTIFTKTTCLRFHFPPSSWRRQSMVGDPPLLQGHRRVLLQKHRSPKKPLSFLIIWHQCSRLQNPWQGLYVFKPLLEDEVIVLSYLVECEPASSKSVETVQYTLHLFGPREFPGLKVKYYIFNF